MLFNSYEFIFVFLPLTLAGFFFLAKHSHSFSAAWLAAASLFFYGFWNHVYVGLLLASITGNYIFGTWISKASNNPSRHKNLLIIAVTLNLLLLGYYKYSNFFLSSINDLTNNQYTIELIILPLGISFFTFTQIAFLVDTYQGKVKEYNFIHYILFVTYFPHLLAGPVLHHREMMPQFAQSSTYRFNHQNLAVGIMIFTIGLFKKTVLADGVAANVAPIFDEALTGGDLTFIDSWNGATSYTLQIYFDFSGYSDMAIGLSRMFGVILPLNFHSPYKAPNLIQFWRRWHMTLTRFLRDYLYIPLGGNRQGKARRYFNLMTTMLLGGLWHGAGWTFVVWGGIHGILLTVNHAWQSFRRKLGHDVQKPLAKPFHYISVLSTFLVVTFTWVFFRSATVDQSLSIVSTMLGFNGFVLDPVVGFASSTSRNCLFIALLLAWFAPNTQQIMNSFNPALDLPSDTPSTKICWGINFKWVTINVLAALMALMFISKLSEFIYFQF